MTHLKTKKDLLTALDHLKINYKIHNHQPVFTVEESEKVTHNIPGGHTKNLFLKDKKNHYFLVTMEKQAIVDLKKIHTLIGAKSRLSFGKPEKLMEYLGVTPGSVTVFSVINDVNNHVKMIIDKPLLTYHIINCHPLLNDATISIARDDLIKFVKYFNHDPLILKLSQ